MPSKIRESLTDMIFKPLSKFEGKKRMFPEDQKNMKILIENYMSKKSNKTGNFPLRSSEKNSDK